MAQSVLYRSSQNEICNDVGDQNAETRILEVFSWQQHRDCALDEELAMITLCLGLIFGRECRVEGRMWIQAVIDL